MQKMHYDRIYLSCDNLNYKSAREVSRLAIILKINGQSAYFSGDYSILSDHIITTPLGVCPIRLYIT